MTSVKTPSNPVGQMQEKFVEEMPKHVPPLRHEQAMLWAADLGVVACKQ